MNYLVPPPLPPLRRDNYTLHSFDPAPTKDFFKYQIEGGSLLASKERYGLHDEMGVGKTATCIYAMDAAKQTRGLIVAPAMLRQNWINELRAFSRMPRQIIKIISPHDWLAWQRGRFEIGVISYEGYTKYSPKLHDAMEILDFTHFDEAHALKNKEANRTKAAFGSDADGQRGAVKWAQQSYHITGTAMPNDPSDLWAFLRFARNMPLTLGEFTDKYLEPEGKSLSRYRVKDSKVQELQELRRAVSLSRSMDDVGLHLPPVYLTEVTLEGDNSDVLALLKEYPGLEDQIVEAVERGSISSIETPYIATLRRLIAKAKAVPFAEMLMREMVTSDTTKIVVYGVHTEALQYIHKAAHKWGIHSVIITGETPDGRRNEAVDKFQNDPDVRLFVGNMVAAGTGITLTRSNLPIIFENNWRPADVAQALKRVHRVGQTNVVRGRFITLAGSLDETLNKIVMGKTREIAKVDERPMLVGFN